MHLLRVNFSDLGIILSNQLVENGSFFCTGDSLLNPRNALTCSVLSNQSGRMLIKILSLSLLMQTALKNVAVSHARM